MLRCARTFLLMSGFIGIFVAASFGEDKPAKGTVARLTHGPFVGHVGPTLAKVWARGAAEGDYTLILSQGGSQSARRVTARCETSRDHCIVWSIDGLRPSTTYTFQIETAGKPLLPAACQRLRTAPADDTATVVRLGFGSCAFDAVNPRFDQPVWDKMRSAGLDQMVFLGDTPYIESSQLAVQRRRYREFYSLPQLAAALREIPLVGVWDDHDFGPNDALGTLPGKEGSRQAFIEYHANPSYGHNGQGIFTKFRRGPVEVFLLDTRWFANTERSPVNRDRMTLLGKAQWDWLTRSLKESTAEVKVLASGMVWNEAVYPGKVDCWVAYPYERHALFEFIGKNNISGVVLVSGDVHLSRVFRFPLAAFAGYDLHEFVSSPLAEGVALYNDIPSSYLKFSAALDNTFLRLTVDSTAKPTTLTAEFFTSGRKEPNHTVTLVPSRDLRRKPR